MTSIKGGFLIASYFVILASSLTLSKTRNDTDNIGVEDFHGILSQAHRLVPHFDIDMNNQTTEPGPSSSPGALSFHTTGTGKIANTTKNVTSPTIAPAVGSDFNAGDVVGVVLGVVTLLLIALTAFLCLRNRRKRTTSQISYIRQDKMNDKSPLTTKGLPGRDPVVPRDGDDILQEFYEDDFEREMRLSMAPPRLDLRLRQEDRRPGDVPTPKSDRRRSIDSDARDGGDVEDEFFYDEVFGQSEFTDERTKSAIKDLSITELPDEVPVPDLMFKEGEFDDIFKTRLS